MVHQLLYNYRDKLLALLSDEVTKHRDKEFLEEETLFQILDELGPPKRKIRPRAGQDIQGLSFLTTPERSGYLTKKQQRSISLLENTKRYWVVLTSGYVHFFNSPQVKKNNRYNNHIIVLIMYKYNY